jgi:hypothetical protein
MIVLVIGIGIGEIIPIPIFINLTQTDRLLVGTGIVSSFITFLAVLTALTKEDIQKLWNKPKLEVSFKDGRCIDEITEKEDKSSIHKAKKYETHLLIENRGNIPAKNCELYLEKLVFIDNTIGGNGNELQLNIIPMKWKGKDEYKIHIPVTGKAYISVLEILSPRDKPISLDDTTPQTQALLKIADFNHSDSNHGSWKATFKLYSENTRPKEFVLIVAWNGKWEQRLPEMKKNCISVDLNLI